MHTTCSSRSQLFSVKYSRLKMQRNALEVWNEIPNEYKKFVKEVLQKRNKKSSSQYPRDWRFLLEAQWDNAKIQTQQNWTNLNQCYNMFLTLRNSRTFFPLQVNICHFLFFPFSCVSFCLFFMVHFFISVLFPVCLN